MDSRDTERGAGGMVPPDYMMVPEEEFDAFNDDTFGNDAETWTEDHHDELVGAHITEEQKNDEAGFFDFDGQDDDGDDMLLGGALEPEGHETAEANGGRVHYLLEEEIHEDDLDIGGSHNISDGQGVESNGHSLTSKFAENLNIKHHVEENLNIGEGNPPASAPLTNHQETFGGPESKLQPSTSLSHGAVSACPQHPNHVHHHGAHQHHDIPSAQMAMPTNPMGTQQQQHSAVIFAAPSQGHQMPIPLIAGFPPAPNMQMNSGVPPPVLAMHQGNQAFPPLVHTQAIHIHNHTGQPLPAPPQMHRFPPSIPPPRTTAGTTNLQGISTHHSQQEFNDPAIMSVSKLPPPRPPLRQDHVHANTLPTNIMDVNQRLGDSSHQPGIKPTIPMNSNAKSVQDIEREMMGGPNARNIHNSVPQPNRFQQQNRMQGQLQHRMSYNGNNGYRQMQSGMRNNQNNQHYGVGGGNNFNHRYGNHHGNFSRPNNSSGAPNPFDDKNRDTFGEDFVMDHQIQQQARQQRYQYGEREHNLRRGVNNLITPGHVHVLGILRGARENRNSGAPAEPTGNPHLDMQQQRHQERNTSGEQLMNNNDDAYSGLMTSRERQWIVNIQLNQLKCENPFLDDYYYTVFNQNRNSIEQSETSTQSHDGQSSETTLKVDTETTQSMRRQRLEATDSISSEDGMKGDLTSSKPQVKRSDEGAQLLLPAETKVADGIAGTGAVSNSGDSYTPKQFTNSLGCLQAVTVKAPRKIIDVGAKAENQCQPSGPPSNVNVTTQKDIKNFKQTLIELERTYSILIDVEDCEKKLTALPTGTSMRLKVEGEKAQAVSLLRCGPLNDASKLKKYMMVRKGKALLVRALRLLDEENMKTFCYTLFSLYTMAARKDRDDQLLLSLWDAGVARHLNDPGIRANFEIVYSYLRLISSGSPGNLTTPGGSRGNSKSPPPDSVKSGNVSLTNIKVVLSTPFGVLVLATCIHNLSLLLQNDDEAQKNEESLKPWFGQLAKELSDCKEAVYHVGGCLFTNDTFLLPKFLTPAEKNGFSKLVAAVSKIE